MAVAAEAQTAIDEQVIEDGDLVSALERRQEKKVLAGSARANYKDANDVVKGKLDALELEEGAVVRCGRFRITKRAVAAKEVSFSTDPSSRLTIAVIADE